MSYTLTAEYGELCEGVQETQARMARAILADDKSAIARYAQEMNDWRVCMDACPKFVEQHA